MYNPVILKRFTPVWNAISQLNIAIPFYAELERKFNKKYDYKVDIYRIFKSIEEQNDWFVACDKPLLQNYMVPQIIHEKYVGIVNSSIKSDYILWITIVFQFLNLLVEGETLNLKSLFDLLRVFIFFDLS